MKTPEKILSLLYARTDGFFGLEELASAAGVKPARLARALEALRQRGHQLEFSPAQGLRLLRPVRPEAILIEQKLLTERVGRNVICFDEVGSTNDVALDSARQDGADGLVVLAESQTRGRGRLGRRWLSRPHANVLMSVVLIDPQKALPHEALTIAAGLAAAEGIEALTGLSCRLKWPNDVLLDGQKVCGVLVEIGRRAGRRVAVVGMGINVNDCPPRQEVDFPATRLAGHLGHPLERVEVARAVLRQLDRWVKLIASGRLEELHAGWTARSDMLNRRATVLSGGRQHVGRVLDVHPRQGLILCDDHGRRIHLPAESSTVLRLQD